MTLEFPKPEKPRRGDAECLAYMAAVRDLPCLVCRATPSDAHHCISGRNSQRKVSDFDTIPLCRPCHTELHAGLKAWERMHGRDTGFIPQTREAVAKLRRELIGGR